MNKYPLKLKQNYAWIHINGHCDQCKQWILQSTCSYIETVLLLKFLHGQIAEFDKGIAPAAVTDQIVRVRMSLKVTASRMSVS